jgi:hypothetical protein
MTPEKRAEFERRLDEILERRRRPKPRVVVEEGRVVGDAKVRPSPYDRNFGAAENGVIEVRSERVWINERAAEEQRAALGGVRSAGPLGRAGEQKVNGGGRGGRDESE